MSLQFETAGEGPAVLLLHGFTGTGATWTPFRDSWAGFRTIAVDLLGHGSSECPDDPARYRLDHCLDDLIAIVDSQGIGRLSVLGYSMGGRMALHLARQLISREPDRLEALILESASPGIDDVRERAARRASDHELAARIEREGIRSFVSRWENLPLFATQTRAPADARIALRAQRLAQNPRGLASALRALGPGSLEPCTEWLGEIGCPVLLIAGALDEKYRGIAAAMARDLKRATVEIMPDAGHAPHFEQPTRFGRVVCEFLKRSVRRNARRNEDVSHLDAHS